jgi:hypothetical protein
MIASIRAITPAIAFGRFPGAGASTNLAFSFAGDSRPQTAESDMRPLCRQAGFSPESAGRS